MIPSFVGSNPAIPAIFSELSHMYMRESQTYVWLFSFSG
ncbi:hypothetical protein GCHA_4280 [Paraglaciecola chathamensis S18K6]|uniref:Uncharacterized protein n=1 Tax=Paraglaciecola chathamensis S18K6 TaxID=1127672 RepID=A0AAV3V6F6_9ALTE|nr:hypothetical protein GCHA_4280 [Paraglaciecola chathamensis S18K6]